MNCDTLHTIRSFFRRFRHAEKDIPGRRCAFLILSATLISSLAYAQTATTVTALPYLLTNDGLTHSVVVVASYVTKPVPAAVSQSPIGGLLGGGFGSVLNGAFTSTEPVAQAIAMASVRSLTILKKANAAKARIQQLNQTAQDEKNLQQAKLDSTGCDESNLRARFGSKLFSLSSSQGPGGAASPHKPNASASRHKLKPLDAPVCTLPEEQAEEEAEAELESISEAGNAAEEAIESAEAAVEAAEAAAAAAETAAQALIDGLDVLEGILDVCGLL